MGQTPAGNIGRPGYYAAGSSPPSEVYYHTRPDLLGEAVPVAGIAGDQQAALFRHIPSPGMAKTPMAPGVLC